MKKLKEDIIQLSISCFVGGVILILLLTKDILFPAVSGFPFWFMVLIGISYIVIIIHTFIQIFKKIKEFQKFDKIMEDF